MNVPDNECRMIFDSVCSPVPVPSHREVAVDLSELEKRVCSSKWRRSAVDLATMAGLRRKLETAIAGERAVEFTVPFGGYKSWHQPSHPLPDWAELFCLSHLSEYFRHVAAASPRGVNVYFTYCSGVMDTVSNMPLSWQRDYISAFERLVERYSTEAIRMELVDIATLYPSVDEMRRELWQNFGVIESSWMSPSNSVNRSKHLSSAGRNLVIEGVEDLSGLSVESLGRRVERSAILCDALDSLMHRRRFNKFEHRIQIVFVRGPELSLHLGSSATSANHFWIGSGVLERSANGRVMPRIVTSDHSFATSETLDTSAWGAALNMPSLNACRIVTRL